MITATSAPSRLLPGRFSCRGAVWPTPMAAPFALPPWILIREHDLLREEWRRHAGAIFVVGFFSIFTYLLILFALTMSKVSYVAAVREVSIVLSAYFGIVCLGGKHGRQKLIGAALITLGVIAIGLRR